MYYVVKVQGSLHIYVHSQKYTNCRSECELSDGEGDSMEKRPDNFKEFRRLAIARRNIYYLFSNAFLFKPTYTLVMNILKKEFLYGISHVVDDDRGIKFFKNFARNFTHNRKNYKALTMEFYDLFLPSGTRYVRPYESAHRDDVTADDVRKVYSQVKVKIPRVNAPPDHFGLELWFMYRLCNLEAKAWEKRRKERFLTYLEIEEGFLGRHLTKWADKLCNLVVELSVFDFYKGVAEITKGYITQDYKEVKELIKEGRDL